MALSRRSRLLLVGIGVVAALVVLVWNLWYPVRIRLILASEEPDTEKATAIGSLGSAAIPALIGLYESRGDAADWDDRQLVGQILALDPYRRVGVLERSLGGGSAVVRRVSAYLLVVMNNADRVDSILDVAHEWVNDPGFGNRAPLVRLLAGLANPLRSGGEPRAAELLGKMLERGEEEEKPVREAVAKALGGTKQPAVIDILVRTARNDPWERVRAWALQSLAEIGWSGDIELFRAVAGSEESVVRQIVANALGKKPIAGGEEILRTLLADPNAVVRRMALGSLADLRSGEIAANAELLREDSFAGIRGDLSGAIQNLALRQCIPVLIQGLLDEEPDDYFNVLRKTVVALHQLTGRHDGFPDEYFKRVRRDLDYEISVMKAWFEKPAKEKEEVVAKWREAYGTCDRRPALLAQLRHADPANVARAARELHRLDPSRPTPGFSREKIEAATRDFDTKAAPFETLVDEARVFQALPDEEREKLLAGW